MWRLREGEEDVGEAERRRRRRVEPTDEWGQVELLCAWPEQLAYEETRPLTLFGASVATRARETGPAERTLYRKVDRFEKEGMESLFGTERARRKRLPLSVRRLVVDLKAEYPGFKPERDRQRLLRGWNV
jgi:hypothetical protein